MIQFDEVLYTRASDSPGHFDRHGYVRLFCHMLCDRGPDHEETAANPSRSSPLSRRGQLFGHDIFATVRTAMLMWTPAEGFTVAQLDLPVAPSSSPVRIVRR